MGKKIKWNYENTYNEALKYKSRSEFSKKCHGAYESARVSGWLDKFTWLEDIRFNLYLDKIDSIYVYEFTDIKFAYVGRTLMRLKKQRDYQHLFDDREDSLAKFIKERNIDLPEMKTLEENLTIKEGVEREGFWMNKYKTDGWTLINKAKAGSIGMLGKKMKTKWDYENTYNEAKKYRNRNEFKINSSGAYESARLNDWLNDFDWFEKPFSWTKELIISEAKKYKTRNEFRLNSGGAYESARLNGWLNDFDWFIGGHKIKWDYENTKQESLKYKTRSDFQKNSIGAYSAARKNGWLTEFFPEKKTNLKWNYETTKKEASKYKKRSEFDRNCHGGYVSAKDHGWLDEFFPKTK